VVRHGNSPASRRVLESGAFSADFAAKSSVNFAQTGLPFALFAIR
jgi:hypothetical protein